MLSNVVLDLQQKRLILYSRLDLFHLTLGYNIKQFIAKGVCYVFVWIQFHLTCKAWRLQNHKTGSSLCVDIIWSCDMYIICSTIVLSTLLHCWYWLYIYIFVVITERAHCFHDNIYYAHLPSVKFEHSVLWITYDHFIYIYKYIYKLIIPNKEKDNYKFTI